MSSITIHNLDKDLEVSIRRKASERHESLNRTIQSLLRESLGLSNRPNDHKEEFMDLFGKWSKEDLQDFEEAIAVFNDIDEDKWK